MAASAIQCATCGWRLQPAAPPIVASAEQPSPAPPVAAPPVASPPVGAAPPQWQTYPGAASVYPPSPSSYLTPANPPGYPTYTQGQPTPYPYAYPPNPYPPNAYSPNARYPQASSYYPYAPVYTPRPKRAPGETYALVISWIVLALGVISIGLGILVVGIGALATSLTGEDSLVVIGGLASFGLAPIVGGIFAFVFGLLGILRRPSPRFSLPTAWLFLILAALVLVAGVVLWNDFPTPGPALAVAPLVMLAGILPALAILALTAHRLDDPSTRRHVWGSLFYGATLAPLLAILFELLASVAIILVARALGQNVASTVLGGDLQLDNPAKLVAALLDISVTAAVVEEMVKPLGAVLIMRRLRRPGEAFLVGLAAGIGFNIVETIGYITSSQADWISIAIQRSTAGLLHGVGAGMAAMGWWYLINGKGAPYRWLIGFGAIFYAMLQHAINNGAAVLLGLVPAPIGPALSQPFYLGTLPIQYADLLFLGYGLLILVVLLWVTGRLRANPIERQSKPPIGAAPTGYPMAQPTIGGSR